MTSPENPHLLAAIQPVSTTNGSQPRDAPRSRTELHPGPLLRRNWQPVVVTAVIVTMVLLPVIALLPSNSSAQVQVMLTGSETDAVFGATSGPAPEEQLQRLLVDLESIPVLQEAARRAATPPEHVTVTATSARDALLAEVSVRAPTDEAARQIADAIPQVVAEARVADIRSRGEDIAAELRSQAGATLDEAVVLEAAILAADPIEAFRHEQQRDALVAQYERLLARAAEIELAAPSRSVGFAVTSPARSAAGAFPPPTAQTVVLVMLIGLMTGVALVVARAVLGGTIQREHLHDPTDHRQIGVVRHDGTGFLEDDVSAAAARLRALPELRSPSSLLVSVVSLGAEGGTTWMASSQLGSAVAESGSDVAVLRVAFETDETPLHLRGIWQPNKMLIDVAEEASEPTIGGRCQLLHARRFGGSPIAAVYSSEIRREIHRRRSHHDVLVVDPTQSGAGGWVEASFRPDLVLIMAVEGSTTHDDYDDARQRLSQSGIAAATLLLTPSRTHGWWRRWSHPDRPGSDDDREENAAGVPVDGALP